MKINDVKLRVAEAKYIPAYPWMHITGNWYVFADAEHMPDVVGLKSFDWALPQEWVNEFHAGMRPRGYVWSYDNEKVFGEPFNLLAAYKERIRQELLSMTSS